MSQPADRYPLSWPVGRPRTPSYQRQRAKFGTRKESGHGWKNLERLTVAEATKRLQEELDRIGAKGAILSSNLQLRLDGLPRSGQPEPADPGVAIYFELKGSNIAWGCDRWDRVVDNIAALAKSVEAKRGLTRWGAVTVEQEFRGYQALPPAPDDWWLILGIPRTATLDQVEAAFRSKALSAHPDKGGSVDEMARLNAARDRARKDLTK